MPLNQTSAHLTASNRAGNRLKRISANYGSYRAGSLVLFSTTCVCGLVCRLAGGTLSIYGYPHIHRHHYQYYLSKKRLCRSKTHDFQVFSCTPVGNYHAAGREVSQPLHVGISRKVLHLILSIHRLFDRRAAVTSAAIRGRDRQSTK
jgi:hypothetical protein